MKCQYCGVQISENQDYCLNCGKIFSIAGKINEPKSPEGNDGTKLSLTQKIGHPPSRYRLIIARIAIDSILGLFTGLMVLNIVALAFAGTIPIFNNLGLGILNMPVEAIVAWLIISLLCAILYDQPIDEWLRRRMIVSGKKKT
jgi:hypothetical protein